MALHLMITITALRAAARRFTAVGHFCWLCAPSFPNFGRHGRRDLLLLPYSAHCRGRRPGGRRWGSRPQCLLEIDGAVDSHLWLGVLDANSPPAEKRTTASRAD